MLESTSRYLSFSIIAMFLLGGIGCGGEGDWQDELRDEVEINSTPLTNTGTYKLAQASLNGPKTATPNTNFTITAKGKITSTTGGTEVHSYALYENATWNYAGNSHKVTVSSGTLVAGKGFNWGSTYSGTYTFKKAAGTYKYTLVFGYRSTAHNWYDAVAEITVTVKAAPVAYSYKVFGKDTATSSLADLQGVTYVQLAPQASGMYYGNIKVSYDKADKVECVSIEENPDGPGMWTWWTSATANPAYGSTGTQYKYSDGGGEWAQKWIAKGKGSGKPGSIDKGTKTSGHVYIYTSGTSSSPGFKPLRLGFKLKKGVFGPVTVTFKVASNALTSYNWNDTAMGTPVVTKVTIKRDLDLKAVVDCKPDVLALNVKSRYVTCYIELPGTRFGVFWIRPATVRLNKVVKAVPWMGSIGDFDNDGVWDRSVRFRRAQVVKLFKPGTHTLTITGKLFLRTFAGTDTVKVVARKY